MSPGATVKTRQRSRVARLAEARERRLGLDPERAAREQRIDEATLEVQDARDTHADAQAAALVAQQAVARGLARLFAERLTQTEIASLTNLDLATVRRLRQLHNDAASDNDLEAQPTFASRLSQPLSTSSDSAAASDRPEKLTLPGSRHPTLLE